MLRVFESVFGKCVSLFEVDYESDVVIPLSAVEEFITLVTNSDIELIPPHVKNLCTSISSPICNWPVLVSGSMRKEVIEQQQARLTKALADNHNYFKTWLKVRSFLDSLEAFQLDTPKLRQVVGDKRTNTLIGRAKAVRPVYTTAGTATGRLTITAGPNFLVLPKPARKCILRSLSSSTIYSIDFTSLEPRVSLWTSNKSVNEQDIYKNVMLMCNVSDREVAKLATLSALYGAGVNRLAGMVKDRTVAKDILARVSDYFSVSELNKRLSAAAIESGVKNNFGRPLFEATKTKRLRVNHFVQSTAAELAILLFANLCQGFPQVRPLLVIHDALIVEVPDEIHDSFIQACNEITYEGFSFPTKQDVLDN